MKRLFCVTVYIFDEQGRESLFVNHRKLQKWLPAGGKVDPDELPDDAALRETFEETGIKVTLLGERSPVEGGLIRPYGVQCNVIKPNELEHIDLIYLACANKHDKPVLSEREASEVCWIPVDKIIEKEFNTFDSVKIWVKKLALELPKSRKN